MTTAEPHVGHSNDNDAHLRVNNSENCGKQELDPSAVEHDAWDGLNGDHHAPMARTYGTVSVMRSPTALTVVDGGPRADIVGK
ncbi:hypothetical protein MRX96_032874 [Rhipicephalus microplus]